MIELTLPLPHYVKSGRRKMLTMNDYRNIHYRVSAQAKRDYKDVAWVNLRPHRREKFDAIEIEYVIFFENHHRRDIGNVGAVIDKFFSDSLVDAGIIDDDDHTIVKKVSFSFGGIGPERVEITVRDAK